MFKEIQEQIQKNIQEPILKIFFEKYSGVYNILTQDNKKDYHLYWLYRRMEDATWYCEEII